MTDSDLMPIGAFARIVGLTASALRFYDDAGVLRPDHVDEVCSADQQRRQNEAAHQRAQQYDSQRNAADEASDLEPDTSRPKHSPDHHR
ncbi:MAG TPA: MerR family DNA-binding transcriptional regulator, partial [Brevibacterium linens]|nr:MerR family DNA-binding transcriptional regulator [Brevibacterium linens]